LDQKDDGVTREVDERLEEIFGGGEHSWRSGEGAGAEEPGEIPSDDTGRVLLRELKATALSLEWEITEDTLDRFVSKTQQLRERYEDDNAVSLLLQLLGSLGKYIKSNKSKSHPDSVRLLNRIFNSVERVASRGDLTQEDKKHILLRRVKEFKKLKEELASSRVPRPAEKKPEQEDSIPKESEPTAQAETFSPAEEMSGMTPHEAFAYALEEIKQVIQSEFKALRAELRLWRESK
jgi:hypothetical protein